MNDQDATKAEFVRTFRSVTFNGKALLQKLEAEVKGWKEYEIWKVLPASKDQELSEDIWLRHFPELYGYRGLNDK